MINNKRQKSRSSLVPRILPNSRKGLSAIVTTLLVILLVLVAVGIVWGVVNSLITGGADTAELAAKCLNIDVSATATTCTAASLGICSITLERSGTNDDVIGGAKLVFENSTGTRSSVVDFPGDVEKLVGSTNSTLNSTIANATKVEITTYFIDASGNEDLCPGDPTEFTF